MKTFAVGVTVAVMLASCGPDRPPPKSAAPNIVNMQPVHVIEGGEEKIVEFDSIDDSDKIEGVRQQIIGERYECTAVKQAWLIEGLVKSGFVFIKATCANNVDYQVTLFEGKAFVKPWNGILIGNADDR